jgi:general nucleoside transport system permease protein
MSSATLLEDPRASDDAPSRPDWRALARQAVLGAAVPVLAIFTALVIGGVLMVVTTHDLSVPFAAYRGLLEGMVGSPQAIAGTLVRSTPYIFTGLAVALAFKCGLFNIGAEGQLALGGLFAAWIGYALHLPAVIHLPLALLAGATAGLVWGAIPGALKARTGAHEVITTIMLNYLAIQFVNYMVSGRMKAPRTVVPQTRPLDKSAWLPMLIPSLQLHSGVLLALLASVAVWWFLARTVWGFALRTVGTNAAAARYAGMSVSWNIVVAMALSGALAGLAGAVEVTGVALDTTSVNHEGNRYFGLGFSTGYGFDAIAVALLARGNPFGVVLAAFLFGGLRAGATKMQFDTQVPGEIISVIQGLILLFVAADVIVRRLYRLPSATATGTPVLTSGWGEK